MKYKKEGAQAVNSQRYCVAYNVENPEVYVVVDMEKSSGICSSSVDACGVCSLCLLGDLAFAASLELDFTDNCGMKVYRFSDGSHYIALTEFHARSLYAVEQFNSGFDVDEVYRIMGDLTVSVEEGSEDYVSSDDTVGFLSVPDKHSVEKKDSWLCVECGTDSYIEKCDCNAKGKGEAVV
jgi:hypothetical protein